MARREGSHSIRLIDLQSEEILSLDLGGPVTDLDISPDGATAFAVVRERSALVRVPLPDGFSDAAAVQEERIDAIFGSITIAPGGDHALLYTTAAAVEQVTIVELGAGRAHTIRLRKSIRAVAMAPDGETALIVHRQGRGTTVSVPSSESDAGILDAGVPDAAVPDSSTADAAIDGGDDASIDASGDAAVDSAANDPAAEEVVPDFSRDPATEERERQIDEAYGFSLVDLATGFAKLQLTEAEVGPLVVVPDGTHAFVLFRDDASAVREVQRVILGNFRIDRIRLASPPNSVGVVGDTGRVFVGQEYPEGRISFIEWASGNSEAVTGFELNSRIVE